MIKRIFALLFLVIVTLGCSVPYVALPQPAGGPLSVHSYRLMTVDPNATATPTPFLPATATPRPANSNTATAQAAQLTGTPSSVANITGTPGNTATMGTPTKTPLPTFPPTPAGRPALGKYPDGQVRILVLGSDARPGGGFRTDIIMLVSINTKHGTATVLSFPRDLWVNLPGWGANRINTAMVYGGFSLMASALESNFGIRPTAYVMTNFNGFTQIIDSLSGVDVTASQTLTDKCKFPINVKGYCTIKPGVTHMNGTFALWYVRSRYSTSDFDRERRSQEVLQATFNKLMSLNAVSRVPELFKIYQKNVETNLSLNDIVSIAPVASQLITDFSKIRRYSVGPAEVSNWTIPGSGAMVLLPNEALIRQLVMQAVFTP